QEGDRVSGGDIVAEIETDKADIELEAFGAGVLRKVLIAPGTSVPVGSLIAVIADPADDIGALVGGTPTPAAPAAPPPASTAPAASPTRPAASPPPGPAAEQTGPRVEAAAAVSEPFAAGGARLKASPLAKKLAERAGIDLPRVKGPGPGGRIIQRDIETLAAAPTPPPAAPPPSAPAPPGVARAVSPPAGEYEDLPLTQLRAAIARQMAQAK